jgi:oxygen-independent coproporphyrinogen-3 oxidase
MASAVVHTPDIEWDRDLIEKYDLAGPRYTSYPTALQFKDEFTEKDYIAQAEAMRDSIAPLSIYVHVPFCEHICYYCACNKIVTNKKQLARTYLDYLAKEIEMQSKLFPAGRKVSQLHWGGGTPTFLSPAEMTELWHLLASHFNFMDAENREYSIEIDPRTVDANSIALLKGLGFNRISMGIQDFNPDVQQAINRIQPYEMIEGLMHELRQHKFKSVSFDLIYGLPHQTMATMHDTLNQVIALGPDRISCYNYAHLPHRFSSQRAIDRLTLPSPEEKLEMLEYIVGHLCEAGYRYVGMDHFVKPEDDLAIALDNDKLQRNFQGYSTCLAPDLIGLGVSSIGAMNNCFAQNTKDLETYYTLIDNHRLPIEKGLIRSNEDNLRQRIIMELISTLHLDITALEKDFSINFSEHFSSEIGHLESMIEDGLLTLTKERLQVTPTGRSLIRVICLCFDEYSKAFKGEQEIRYSRII